MLAETQPPVCVNFEKPVPHFSVKGSGLFSPEDRDFTLFRQNVMQMKSLPKAGHASKCNGFWNDLALNFAAVVPPKILKESEPKCPKTEGVDLGSLIFTKTVSFWHSAYLQGMYCCDTRKFFLFNVTAWNNGLRTNSRVGRGIYCIQLSVLTIKTCLL